MLVMSQFFIGKWLQPNLGFSNCTRIHNLLRTATLMKYEYKKWSKWIGLHRANVRLTCSVGSDVYAQNWYFHLSSSFWEHRHKKSTGFCPSSPDKKIPILPDLGWKPSDNVLASFEMTFYKQFQNKRREIVLKISPRRLAVHTRDELDMAKTCKLQRVSKRYHRNNSNSIHSNCIAIRFRNRN